MCALSYLLYVKPFTENLNNLTEVFNETCFIAVSYTCLLLTDFLPEKGRQYNVGWSLIVITCLNMLVNGLLIIY